MLSENLKAAREKKGYSKSYVAKELGVTTPMVNYFESGLKIPTVCNLVALSQLYEVSIDALTDNVIKPARRTKAKVKEEE